jgi:hypothetical protein
MNLTYDDPFRMAPGKHIHSAFFFTMNLTEEYKAYYTPLFESTSGILRLLGGQTEYHASYDTFQFSDYSQYAAGFFDAEQKKRRRMEQWPLDCANAYDTGKRLASASLSAMVQS